MSTNTAFPEIGKLADKTATSDGADQKADQDEERPLEEIESLCMACREQGVTRLMLTSIPYFKEVIVSSFRCEHCGAQNNEIQSAGTIRDHGLAYTLKIISVSDLSRQLVKSSYATISFPDLELTLPPSKGQLTTIEGLLRGVCEDLEPEQVLRRIQDPPAYTKIQAILDRLRTYVPEVEDEEADEQRKIRGDPERVFEKPLTLKVDDPSGESFVEFMGSTSDPKWNMREYTRTVEDNVALGLASPDALAQTATPATKQDKNATHIPSGDEEKLFSMGSYGESKISSATQKESNVFSFGAKSEEVSMDEVFIFPGICSSCSKPVDTKMKRVDIPYFKEIIIMSTNCEACGYRDNEVKSSGAVSEKGKKITLKVQDSEDLSRDILKSETCGLAVPEIDLVLTAGTLGGRFTTLEGILDQIYDELSEKLVLSGDSAPSNADHNALNSFLSNLKTIKSGERFPFTVILDDPLSNSYMQNLYAPDPDPEMGIEMYKRTKEQEDELGLSDMNVEGYEERVIDDEEEIPDGHALQSVKEEPEPAV